MASISDLARRLDVDPSYICRILRLTTLAPDIVKAILQGRESACGLTIRSLHGASYASASAEDDLR